MNSDIAKPYYQTILPNHTTKSYYQTKIVLIKKLRTCWTQGMLAIFRCRIFRLTVC